MKNKILKESENLELQNYIRDIMYGDGFVTLEKIDFDIYHAPYNFTVDDVVREARHYGFELRYIKDEGYALVNKDTYNESLNDVNDYTLTEKFSRNIPDWVIQHIDKRYSPIKDKLSRTIDLNTAEWEPIDKNNITAKDISNDDPNRIRIFRLDFDGTGRNTYTYIPGYEDGGYTYLPRDGKYHYISKMAKKDIINAIIDGGVLTCDSQALSKKRQDRADAMAADVDSPGTLEAFDALNSIRD